MLPVLGHQRDSGRHGVPRRLDAHRPPSYFHRSSRHTVQAEQCAAQLGSPRAYQPCHSHNLAFAQRKGNIPQQPRAQPGHPQELFSRRQRLPVVDRVQLPAHHVPDQFLFGQIRQRARVHRFPIPQNRHPVPHRTQLFQTMRDVDHPHLPIPQRLDDPEYLRRLCLGKRRGRLIENQKAGPMLNRPANLHHLLARRAQPLYPPLRLQRKPVVGDHALGLFHHLAPVHHAPPTLWRPPQKDVLRDRQMRRQQGLLMHHRDAHRRCIGRSPEAHPLPFPHQFAAPGSNHPGHDFHQRRFARPVLPHQQMHLPCLDREIAVAQRRDSAETFGDIPRL
ncbi:MAG: hypothetical protein R2762_02260 [Bryobacteraceae bacterium]